jgi:WD40 repeat protein
MVNCVAYSLDGRQIVSGHGEGQLRIWEAETGGEKSKWIGHPAANGLPRAAMTMLSLWDALTGSLISVFAGHSDRVTGAAFSPQGSRLASSSWDKTLRLWDMMSTGSHLSSSGSPIPF